MEGNQKLETKTYKDKKHGAWKWNDRSTNRCVQYNFKYLGYLIIKNNPAAAG
jgi:hypothetical protein